MANIQCSSSIINFARYSFILNLHFIYSVFNQLNLKPNSKPQKYGYNSNFWLTPLISLIKPISSANNIHYDISSNIFSYFVDYYCKEKRTDFLCTPIVIENSFINPVLILVTTQLYKSFVKLTYLIIDRTYLFFQSQTYLLSILS